MPKMQGLPVSVNLGKPSPPEQLSQAELDRRIIYFAAKVRSLQHRMKAATERGDEEKAAVMQKRLKACLAELKKYKEMSK